MKSPSRPRQKTTRARDVESSHPHPPSRPNGRFGAATATAPAPHIESGLTPIQWMLVFVGLATLVALVYHPVWHGGLLWDDDGHITKPELRSLGGLWRVWFELGATQQYYPVVHSAFWMMAHLWGDDTLGYHLVNIFLHATSAFLVVRILDRVRIPGALLAGVLFAVHPVHAESVAWITELKNALSGTLYLTAALIYLRFDTSRSVRVYVAAFVVFVLALLSKSVTATLPVVMLVLLWERRGRVTWARDVQPLIPFVVIGVGTGLLTAWVERTYIGAAGADFNLSFVERCLVAGRAVWFYLWKLLWPTGFIFYYPRWTIDAGIWWQYLFPLTMLAVLVVAWWWRQWSRAPLAALLFFGITLAPALGFVDVFPFKFSYVADHFQYLASLGILTFVAATVTVLVTRWWPGPVAQALVIAALGVPLAAVTWQQSHQYVDGLTLYRTTIARNPNAWLAHNNLAMISLERVPPDLDTALKGFETALAIVPNEPLVRFNVGTALYRMGRVQDALVQHREAVRLAPNYAEAWGNLGTDLQKLGRNAEAVDAYRRALAIKPEMPAVRGNLGVALLELGHAPEASAELRASVKTGGATATEHVALAASFLKQGRIDESIAEYREALKLSPGSPEILNDLGYTLTQAGRLPEAERVLRDALARVPTSAAAHANLGNVLQGTGRLEESLNEYRAALETADNQAAVQVHNDFGVALARLGRRDEAIVHFREALRLHPGFASARANLARALGGS